MERRLGAQARHRLLPAVLAPKLGAGDVQRIGIFGGNAILGGHRGSSSRQGAVWRGLGRLQNATIYSFVNDGLGEAGTPKRYRDKRPGLRFGKAWGLGSSDEGKLRSEEHTSELQSLMRISYAVFCLKKKTTENNDRRVHKQ